ncbi:MAG TPA: hypothetical protein VJK54_03415, partial [Chthoniobacterales bacterium]|nr:hypothetical protein [Chthoniobacterales bacterium]
ERIHHKNHKKFTKNTKKENILNWTLAIFLVDMSCFVRAEVFKKRLWGTPHFLQTLKNNTPSRHSRGRGNPEEGQF